MKSHDTVLPKKKKSERVDEAQKFWTKETKRERIKKHHCWWLINCQIINIKYVLSFQIALCLFA